MQRGRRKFLAALALACSLGGCSLYAPLPAPSSLDDRLDVFPTVGLPLDARVIVRWNDHQIPYIEAQSDADGAFVLGLVHAHLRLGQMEVARRVAKGRISEMAGPFFTDIDRSLRALGFGRASPAIVAAWPAETRRWVSRFVDGINHYQSRMRETPHEYRVFALVREPWAVEDVVTLGRLAGTDVTWLTWMALLPFRDDPDWPRIWRQALELGGLSPPSFALPPEFRLAWDDSESDEPRPPLAAEKREAVEHAARLAKTLAGFSYTLYLVHLPPLVFGAAAISAAGGGRWQPGLGHLAFGTAIALAILGYAFALSRVTEARTDAIRRRHFGGA